MRASRLVTLVLLLQARGPWTADELAERLEVSVRTVHRDVEALRASGVPIRGERGPAGGYRLPGGYRTRLTGLTPDEAEALFLAAPADALGLGGFLADAQLKLLAALPPQLRDRADRAAQLFHVDHRSWFGPDEQPPALGAIAGALWHGRRLRLVHRGRERVVDPLGLVLKGPSWYLIGATERGERTFRVGRVERAVELEQEARRPPQFDLVAHWDAWSRAFEDGLPYIAARVRVAPHKLGELRRVVDSRRRDLLPRHADGDEWLELEVWFERIEHAEGGLLGLGAHVEVLAPPELRTRIEAHVATLARRYGVEHPSSS
ncbi:helix-turn-helix transcriptional regulator [Conexibacter woesei]|uniref:Helix-turn-helix type 11 domain protein n=1 Tax=Conexibacter woesei (strain DSM 14684 / CCUG 47730 / CIP 108061 / JCM 11494 / NBRC 100937 / ID131577) TaxID=469383 RepID=D3F3Z7_CONWI|nr:YafY family protein [Conexibacter woesei]ADB48480.1 Helix-turn-helix type 11 domain protein [Conexibacter woesei DSM 14684]